MLRRAANRVGIAIRRPLATRATGTALTGRLHPTLTASTEPIITIELLSRGATRGATAEQLLAHRGGRPLARLRPHAGASILLGDTARHSYSEIVLTEWSCGESAAAACAQLEPLEGGAVTTLAARRSAAFAGMPTFEQSGGAVPPVDTAPARAQPSSACPFAYEPSALPWNWDALEAEPTQEMYAFNILRIPEAQLRAYAEYSAHFKPLPSRYGMKFVEVW